MPILVFYKASLVVLALKIIIFNILGYTEMKLTVCYGPKSISYPSRTGGIML